MSEKLRALKSLSSVASLTIAGTASNFLFLVVTSRLLGPSEFGVVAATQLFVIFAEMFSRSGVGVVLVQAQNVTEELERVALTMALVIALAFQATLLSGSWLIAEIMNIPEIESVLPAMGWVILASAFNNVSGALMQRNGKATLYSALDVGSAALGSWLIAVPLAIFGLSYWSIVLGRVVQAILMAIFCYGSTKHSLAPCFNSGALKEVASKGIGFFSARLLNYIATQGDYFVASSYFGAIGLGTYSRAYNLMNYPSTVYNTAVDRVMLPAFARFQDDRARLRKALLFSFELTHSAAIPISVFIAIAAPQIVYVVLGEDWKEVTPILAILGGFAFFRLGYKLAVVYFGALGLTRVLIFHNLIYAIAVVVGAWAAAPYGLNGIAYAVGCALVLHWIFLILRIASNLKLTLRESISTVLSGMISGIVVWIVLHCYIRNSETGSAFIDLALMTLAAASLSVLTYFISRRILEGGPWRRDKSTPS